MCVIDRFEIGGTRIDESGKTAHIAARRNDPQYIEGYSVVECDLKKELLKPSVFTFTLRHDTPGKKSLDVIDKLIGKPVFCQILTKAKEGNPDSILQFNGIIDKVSLKGINITCIAFSEDCKLQGPAKCRCFYDMKIADIVNAIVTEHHIQNQIDIKSEIASLVFPYIVQYNESDYEFLVRLAKRFGAFLYYRDVHSFSRTQKCLIFGKLPSITVNHIDDAKSVSYELETGNSKYWFVAHHGEKDLQLASSGKSYSSAIAPNKLTKLAVDASTEHTDQDKACFIDYPYSLTKTPKKEDIELHNTISLFSDAGRMVTCKFICYRFDVQVGDVVSIDNNSVLVVTAAHLTWDCNGSPQNEVTAMRFPNNSIALNNIIAPYVDFNAYPKSSAQRAKVINNLDELKMGRVQVLFDWQSAPANDDEKKKFPWIRIAQPYGGGKADKGQGCYILPEIGEEVMVGFEHDNLEKPYVIGTLYHNSDTADNVQMPETTWVETDQANKNNEIKAFRTKKGHTIEFHDVDGDNNYGFIRIYGNEKKDQPNYDIILSTDKMENSEAQDKHYSLKSADDQATTTKEIKIDKEYKAEKLRLMVKSNGGDIMLDAGDGDIYLNAKNIHYSISGSRTTYIKEKDITSVGGDRFVDVVGSDSLLVRQKQDLLVKGDTTAKHEGTVTITDSKTVKFKAQSLTLQTDQKTEMKASDINVDASSSVKVNANSSTKLSGPKIEINANSSVEITAFKQIDIRGVKETKLYGSQLELEAMAGTRKGIWKDQ